MNASTPLKRRSDDVDESGPADTRVMGIVHSALRRDLVRARATLTDWPYPFDEQRIALADHLVWMMNFLHNHHESEDKHLYPMIRQRNSAAAALLDEMDADHRSIEPAMAQLVESAAAYRDSADARTRVIAALDALSDVLLPHLEREEQQAMPLVSATITDAEWRRWDDEFNVKPMGPIELADSGLFVLDGLEGPDRDHFSHLVPAIPRWFVLNVMIHRYRRKAFRCWRSDPFSPLKTGVRGQQEVLTAATPQNVWDILADVTRVGEWSHECQEAHWLDGATTPNVGAEFRGHSRSGFMRWSQTCRFTVVEEPHEMVWVTQGVDSTEWRFTLEAIPSGTRIVQTYRVLKLPIWLDRLFWVLTPAHHDRRDALRDDLTRLARLAELKFASANQS